MVFEIQANLKRLQRIKIHYTSRNCNEVARSLAKTTLEQVNFVSWLDNNPAQYMYLFFQTLWMKAVVSSLLKKKKKFYNSYTFTGRVIYEVLHIEKKKKRDYRVK